VHGKGRLVTGMGHAGWLGLAQPHGPGWAEPKQIQKNSFLKFMIFCKYFTAF
jgi:hypothetical protein